jgi:hypothetical protein
MLEELKDRRSEKNRTKSNDKHMLQNLMGIQIEPKM